MTGDMDGGKARRGRDGSVRNGSTRSPQERWNWAIAWPLFSRRALLSVLLRESIFEGTIERSENS